MFVVNLKSLAKKIRKKRGPAYLSCKACDFRVEFCFPESLKKKFRELAIHVQEVHKEDTTKIVAWLDSTTEAEFAATFLKVHCGMSPVQAIEAVVQEAAEQGELMPVQEHQC